jgi:hypothetical protein
MNLEQLAKDHELELLRHGEEQLTTDAMQYLDNIDLLDAPLSDEEHNEIYEWLEKDNLGETIYRLIARVVLDGQATAQALVGMMYNKLRSYEHKQHIIDIMLNAVSSSKFIEVNRLGMYLMFTCKNKLPKEIADKRKQLSYVLPSIDIPLKITNNSMIGYRTINQSIICGGVLKHHDKPLNLNHINRVNRTPYRVDNRIQFLVTPKFDSEPKMKDDGNMESELDVSKRFETWSQLMDELPSKAKLMAQNGNRFYIHHRFDNGGRCYAKAHHFNYQSIAYIKAMIQSYNKELVEPEF